jgi:hypothetical protein
MLITTKKAVCTRVPTTRMANGTEKVLVSLTMPITSVTIKGISQAKANMSVRIM